MYDIIYQIISHAWDSSYSNSEQQYIYFTCCALILVLTAVFIDMVVRIFFRFTGIR